MSRTHFRFPRPSAEDALMWRSIYPYLLVVGACLLLMVDFGRWYVSRQHGWPWYPSPFVDETVHIPGVIEVVFWGLMHLLFAVLVWRYWRRSKST